MRVKTNPRESVSESRENPSPNPRQSVYEGPRRRRLTPETHAERGAKAAHRRGLHRPERKAKPGYDCPAAAIHIEAHAEGAQEARLRLVLRPESRLDARLDADVRRPANAERNHRVRD